jgi:hypothetical protein
MYVGSVISQMNAIPPTQAIRTQIRRTVKKKREDDRDVSCADGL